MAAGRPTNTPTFRRLHHPRILHMFHNSSGTLLARRTLVQTTCLFQTVWPPVWNCPGPYIWVWPAMFVCLLSLWSLSRITLHIFFCLAAPELPCCVQCRVTKTKVVFHISVESNLFSFEPVQHVQPVTFFIIGLAGFCSCQQKPTKIKKTNDSCTFSKPFLPQAVICIMVKNSSHKSHQIFHDTLSVYHLAKCN